MPRWTAENLADYAKRQMAASPNTRREIREKAEKSPYKCPLCGNHLVDVGGYWGCLCQNNNPVLGAKPMKAYGVAKLDSLRPNRDCKCPDRVQSKTYNIKVVLAWFKECGLPAPVPEYRFDKKRKWRFDFAFCPGSLISKVAVEVQGGLFTGGAHVRGAALLREHEKLNAAAIAGWRVLFVTPDQLCTQDTAEMIRQALRFHLE